MKPFAVLRGLVLLRRIAVALERANDLQLHRQELEFPRLGINREAKPKKVVISQANTDTTSPQESMLHHERYTGV